MPVLGPGKPVPITHRVGPCGGVADVEVLREADEGGEVGYGGFGKVFGRQETHGLMAERVPSHNCRAGTEDGDEGGGAHLDGLS